MSDGIFSSDIPTVCGPHRTFPSEFRKRTCFKITIVCVELRRRKKHACSESSRRMLGSIELNFSRLVVVFYITALWTVGIGSDSVYARQLERNSDGKFHRILPHRKFRSCIRGIRGPSGLLFFFLHIFFVFVFPLSSMYSLVD